MEWREDEEKDGNNSLPKNNLIQDSEGNEENEFPVPDSNKTNDAKGPNNAQKNTLKKKILQINTENSMELLLDMVNQNIQDPLRKFQDNKNKEYENTQKQMNS
jgi:hypothetical protein